ncbi:MAG TPA: acyltransferase family protein, partial [Tianweitania sediminis]|nr:acyltransferase family protein [Tianweitania sediminis]
MTRHPTDEPLASTSGRLAALDLLRLVAALCVVAFHYLFRGSAGEPFLDAGYPELAPFALYGYLGVSLFFAISGFVIAWSAEGRDWIGFATSRFTRLYPGFLICMTASFLVLFAVGDSRLPVTPEQWAANLVILSPALGQPFVDGVYWSIVLELVFYGWVTLALATGQFQKRPLVLVAGWLLLAAVNEFVIDHPVLRMVFIT